MSSASTDSSEEMIGRVNSVPRSLMRHPMHRLDVARSVDMRGPERISEKLKRGIGRATGISVYLLGSLLLCVRMCIVGVALHVILNGIHHFPRVGALPVVLCVGYLLLVAWKAGQYVCGKAPQSAAEVFDKAYSASRTFFWWNLGGFGLWAVLVLAFKGQVDPWFAPAWALLSSIGVLTMTRTILRMRAHAPGPEWPAAIFDEMKTEFRKEIEADGENGPCEITCTRGRYNTFLMCFVEDYADRHPAIKYHEEEITRRLDETTRRTAG